MTMGTSIERLMDQARTRLYPLPFLATLHHERPQVGDLRGDLAGHITIRYQYIYIYGEQAEEDISSDIKANMKYVLARSSR